MSPNAKLASLAGPALRMQPDARLARLAREGSVQAFEEIVRRYRPRLVAFAAGIVPPHRAEDIVQESLERVFTALRESTTEVHLKPWLYTIVRNRSLNAVRDERVHVELDEEHDGVTPPPEILARREEVAALVAGIQALPEAQRQALVGRELEGLSHDQIAAELGTSPGSVRGLIFRARTAIRHAAGAVVPLPLVRWLLAEASATPGAADAAAGGGVVAAGVAAAGSGGGGLGAKAGAVLAAGVLAAGAGVGLDRNSAEPSGGGQGARAAQGPDPRAAPAHDEDHGGDDPGPAMAGGARGDGGAGDDSGPGGDEVERGDDRSGPGGGDDDGEDSSGPGGGGESGHGGGDDDGGESGGDGGHGGSGSSGPSGGDDDNSGPGGGDEPEPVDDDNSGRGGDDDAPEPPDDDSSGPGGGDD